MQKHLDMMLSKQQSHRMTPFSERCCCAAQHHYRTEQSEELLSQDAPLCAVLERGNLTDFNVSPSAVCVFPILLNLMFNVGKIRPTWWKPNLGGFRGFSGVTYFLHFALWGGYKGTHNCQNPPKSYGLHILLHRLKKKRWVPQAFYKFLSVVKKGYSPLPGNRSQLPIKTKEEINIWVKEQTWEPARFWKVALIDY